MSSEEEHEDDQSAGEPFLWKQAEKAEVVQHREQNVLGELLAAF